MKIKNIQQTRLFSSLLVIISTVMFLFTCKYTHFFNLFNTTKQQSILFLVGVGLFIFILGLYLAIRTFRQYKRNKEVVQTKHKDRGIYRIVRNPIYSSIFLLSSGILFSTYNYFAIFMVFFHWIILTLVIIFLEEPRLIEQLDEDYLEYTLQVNRLIPWFGKYFETKKFNQRDEIYLQRAEEFVNKKIKAPVMGIHFESLLKVFWFRRGICLVTDEEVIFYSYDVFRGHFAQVIPFTKISSFIYGKNNFGYSLRVFASGTMINLYFIQKGEFEVLVDHINKHL